MTNEANDRPLTNDEKRARLAGGLGRGVGASGAAAPRSAADEGKGADVASGPGAHAGSPVRGSAPGGTDAVPTRARSISDLADEKVDRKLLVRGVVLCAVVVVAAVVLIMALSAGVQS